MTLKLGEEALGIRPFPYTYSTGLDFFSVNGEHLKLRNIAFLEKRRQLTPT
jgi:hypothetical protein